MGIILGIDIGGSTTKLVGLDTDGNQLGTLQIKASSPTASAFGALGSFLTENNIPLSSISRITLTGVGASFIRGPMYSIPTNTVEEFTAIGRGGLSLSGLSEALVVSMGTGTAFIRSSLINGFSHIGGSGVGGGTIMGLCSRLTCAQHFDTITKLAERGNLSQVDLMVKDIFQGAISTLPADVTAANFGHWADSATEEDTALGVLNMVFQTVGMMAVFACRNDTTRDVVLTGSLTEIPQAVPIFHTLSELHNISFQIPKDAVFATALGAALHFFC